MAVLIKFNVGAESMLCAYSNPNTAREAKRILVQGRTGPMGFTTRRSSAKGRHTDLVANGCGNWLPAAAPVSLPRGHTADSVASVAFRLVFSMPPGCLVWFARQVTTGA